MRNFAFERPVVWGQAIVAWLAFAVTGAFAPALLRLREEEAWAVLQSSLVLGIVSGLGVLFFMKVRVGRLAPLLEELRHGKGELSFADLKNLGQLPVFAVITQLAVGALLMVIWGSSLGRPRDLPEDVAVVLSLLGVMVVLGAAIPALVIVRLRVAMALECADPRVVFRFLSEEERPERRSRRTRRNLAFAMVVPIVIVGIGGTLATHATLRSIRERQRLAAAWDVSRLAGPAPERSMRARLDTLGFVATHAEKVDKLPAFMPREGELSLPFGLLGVTSIFAAATLLLSFGLARLISDDLERARLRIEALGTHEEGAEEETFSTAIRESKEEGAHFAIVTQLLMEAFRVADLFRVFAATERRAVLAKEQSEKARGLLFATVSHDLKSPLNAIVGFADALDGPSLPAAQRESLALIATRGRELIALIETILDAARVDAGQLRLDLRLLSVPTILNLAIKLAKELAQGAGEFKVEEQTNLPLVRADITYAPRALSVILAYAFRESAARERESSNGSARTRVIIRTGLAWDGDAIRVEIDPCNASFTREELQQMFERISTKGARGLALGMNLAKSILELHGTTLEFVDRSSQSPVIVVLLPLGKSSPRPNEKPTLTPNRARAPS